MNLKLWAALSAVLGLCASGAQAAVLIYSANGVISSDALSIVNTSVAIPAGGYTQPIPINPLADPFRGEIDASGGNYTVVLTTNATPIFSDVSVGYFSDLELWSSGAPFGVSGWLPGGAGPSGYQDIFKPSISGDTYTWLVGAYFFQDIDGCAPDSWSTCDAIKEILQEPRGLDIQSEFDGAVDAGATWSLQIYADIPEPAEWSLMTLGIGLLGAGLRRRRATAALSNARPEPAIIR